MGRIRGRIQTRTTRRNSPLTHSAHTSRLQKSTCQQAALALFPSASHLCRRRPRNDQAAIQVIAPGHALL